MRNTAYRACDLCEAICGLELQFEDGALAAIRGDAADPFSQGHICPKGNAILDLLIGRDVPGFVDAPLYTYRGTVTIGPGQVQLGRRIPGGHMVRRQRAAAHAAEDDSRDPVSAQLLALAVAGCGRALRVHGSSNCTGVLPASMTRQDIRRIQHEHVAAARLARSGPHPDRTRRSGGPRPSSGWRWAPGGRCWCRGRPHATCCFAAAS